MSYLQWRPWVYGLFSSLIGGGAGAVVAAIGVNLMDSKDWNVSDHPAHLIELMGLCFVMNGALSTFAYLAKSPLPQVESTTTKQTVSVEPTGDGIKAVTTTEVTKQQLPAIPIKKDGLE